MIDHTGLKVSKTFYEKALAPLGYAPLKHFTAEQTGREDVAGLGAPGLRPLYHEQYFGAFVLDPDGHNIEACFHQCPNDAK